jgi:uncharacterized RDD family membrane protein YckC
MPADPDATVGAPAVRAASLWARLAAGLVDLAVEVGLAAAVTMAWFAWRPAEFPPRYWNHPDYLVDLVNTRPDLAWPPVLAFVIVYIAWETAFAATLGNSPFARLLGMRVVTGRGRPIGVVRAFVRASISLAFAATAFAGPLWAMVSPRRRMLHDILCGCHVARGDVPVVSCPGPVPVDDGVPTWESGPRR